MKVCVETFYIAAPDLTLISCKRTDDATTLVVKITLNTDKQRSENTPKHHLHTICFHFTIIDTKLQRNIRNTTFCRNAAQQP